MTAPLPFTLKVPGMDTVSGADVSSTSYRFHGLLRFDGHSLHLEWAGTADIDEVSGLDVRSETVALPTETLSLPVHRLRSAVLRAGWWRPHLELTGSDLAALAIVPGEQLGRLRLWLARDDREHARRVVEGLREAIATPLLDEGDAPPPTPPGRS